MHHETKVWYTIKKKNDLWLKKWHQEFGQFSCEQLKLWQIALWWASLSKAFKDLDENVQKSDFLENCRVKQSLKKNWVLFPKGYEELVNFNASNSKSENLHFIVLLLSITYEVSAKKVQMNDLSWHYRVIHTLKKNWFLFEKWNEQFGESNVWVKKYGGIVQWKMTYDFKNDIKKLVNFHTSILK